jgi:hypothetical protein
MLMVLIYWVKHIYISKNKTEALLSASKDVDLEVNTEKTNHMLMSHHQNTGQNHNIKADNRLSENVGTFLYFRMIVTDQRCIHKKFKSRLNLGNV